MLLAISNGLARIFHSSTTSNLIGCPKGKCREIDSSHKLLGRFRIFTNLLKGNSKSPVRYRLLLQAGEVFRFPECQEFHVLSGVAWITVAREDIILASQEKALLSSHEDAVISALGKAPLILEVL